MTTLHINLSNKAIEQHQGRAVVLRDTAKSKLYFRYGRCGTKGTFYLVRRPGRGKPAHWLRLGTWPDLSVSRARDAYDHNYRRIVNAQPVVPDDTKPLRTVHDVLLWFKDRRAKEIELSDKTRINTRQAVNRACTLMENMPVSALDKATINTQLYEAMLGIFRLSTFEITLKTIKAAFAQAHELELVTANPVADITYASFTKRRPANVDCRLDEKAISGILNQLKRYPLKKRMLFCWLLMHGTRISETSLARFDRMAGGAWEIRESEAKTQLNRIPLSDTASRFLERYRSQLRKEYGYRGQYLFYQNGNRRRPISGNHASNQIIEIGGGKYSAHDIRRRARTWWASNDVDYFVGELLIGHKIKGLDAKYIQTVATPACRAALEKWHQYLVGQGLFGIF